MADVLDAGHDRILFPLVHKPLLPAALLTDQQVNLEDAGEDFLGAAVDDGARKPLLDGVTDLAGWERPADPSAVGDLDDDVLLCTSGPTTHAILLYW